MEVWNLFLVLNRISHSCDILVNTWNKFFIFFLFFIFFQQLTLLWCELNRYNILYYMIRTCYVIILLTTRLLLQVFLDTFSLDNYYLLVCTQYKLTSFSLTRSLVHCTHEEVITLPRNLSRKTCGRKLVNWLRKFFTSL